MELSIGPNQFIGFSIYRLRQAIRRRFLCFSLSNIRILQLALTAVLLDYWVRVSVHLMSVWENFLARIDKIYEVNLIFSSNLLTTCIYDRYKQNNHQSHLQSTHFCFTKSTSGGHSSFADRKLMSNNIRQRVYKCVVMRTRNKNLIKSNYILYAILQCNEMEHTAEFSVISAELVF